MIHMLVPKPTMTPFVTKRPTMLFELKPLRIWRAPSNAHAIIADVDSRANE